MSLKPGTGIPRPRTVHESLILLEMQHTDQMAFMHSKGLIKLQGRRVIGKCLLST